MPIVVDAHGLGPHLVLRRLDKGDLDGLADVLPAALALGGDVDPWFGEAACA